MAYPTYQPGYMPYYQRETVPPTMNTNTPGLVQAQQGFTCRPVTSREEAVATQIDFFGPGTIMPDLAHGVIYLKRFNQNTGGADFYEFTVAPAPEPPKYATLADLEALREELTKPRKAAKKDDAE